MLFVTNCLPGAFAKAVIIVIEAIGTWPTDANKGAQALRREQVGPDTGLLTKTAGWGTMGKMTVKGRLL